MIRSFVTEKERNAIVKELGDTETLFKFKDETDAKTQVKEYNDMIEKSVRAKQKKPYLNPSRTTQQTVARITEVHYADIDIKKITSKIGKQLRKLYDEQDFAGLVKLHNDNKLSPVIYCCSSQKEILNIKVGRALKEHEK